MTAPEPTNSVAVLSAPELCTVCGESICEGDPVDELDGETGHKACVDKFIEEMEAEHEPEPDGRWCFSTEAGCWLYE